MSGADSVECDRNKRNILADALSAALCAHDLVVRELVVLAIHACLFDKGAGVGACLILWNRILVLIGFV